MLHVLDRHAIGQILRTKEVDAWGVAANEPRLPGAPDYPVAIAILMRLDPLVVRGLKHGPTREYQQEYFRLNGALDDATGTLVDVLRAHGHRAERVPATSDEANGERPFPHKTAATTAGLGWIGKTALFVSPQFGPAVRLGTVFTDLELPPGEAVVESSCGACRECVDACPAGCGRDVIWQRGMSREQLFDAGACRHHMTSFMDVEADICGICIAACPLSSTH
jgi:epoxyqueuosine reductase QueG